MRAVVSGFLLAGLIVTSSQISAMVQTARRDESSGDAAKGITVGMLYCIHDEIHRQDVRLNRVDRNLMARLDPVRRQKLQNTERAWIKHREAKCMKDAHGEEGGTTWLLIYNQCIETEEEFRANFLERYR